ncbi:MAG: PorV/PorQ family protein [Elusimicrobia bacterium]|nr:PorV/PorQ family protein [Elusimicrobiota bacterium]
MKKSVLISAAVCLISSASVSAGGTTAAFLKLNSDARSAALGGAFVSLARGVSALSYNPAGLTKLKKSEIGFSRTELVENISYNFFGYSRRTRSGALGLGIDYLNHSSIEGRNADRTATGSFGASDVAVNLAYGMNLNPESSLGFNIKYIRSSIESKSGAGWAIDAGWQGKAPIIRGLSVGMAVRNIGPGIKYMDESSPLPLSASAGAGYPLPGGITIAVEARREINERETIFSFGSECAVFGNFTMRAGYLKNSTGFQSEAEGFKTGFGLKYGEFSIDYASSPFADIGKSHTVTLGAKF